MANTLTGMIPTLYESRDVVSREMVGLVPAVSRNASGERAALNETITIPVAPAASATDVTPGTTAPNTGDQTIGFVNMSISKSRAVYVRWNGEEMRGYNNNGQLGNTMVDQFAQAMRTLVNEMESDLAALYVSASRAYGTAGTAPFGTAGDLSDVAQIRAILEDNGAPTGDLHLALSSAAIANLRGKQNVLFKVNEAGTDAMLRRGDVGALEGFAIHNSAQIKAVTKGTGASYVTNNAPGYAVGDSTLAVDTGTGTVLAGDVITFAGDTNKYVVGTALSAGSLAINAPGLRATLADGVALTVGANYRANLAFSRNAIQLIARAPALPMGPDGRPMDMADDTMPLVDPVTGISFQITMYRQFKQIVYEVALAWGTKCIKPEHLAILLG